MKRPKPDFLCIGPTRTGTSWFYAMFIRHREIWLPPFKEIRFLNEGNIVPHHSLWNVFFSQHWHYKILRANLHYNLILMKSPEDRKYRRFRLPWWFFRYCFGRRSYKWYDGLFLDENSRLTGDVSPNYYEIPEEKIRQFHQHNPSAKIIMFIRNPIERVWSLSMMVLGRETGREFHEIPTSEFQAFFNEILKGCTPYLETIALWKSYFPELFIGFYDALQEDPVAYFKEIAVFLGIDETRIPERFILDTINQGNRRPIPDEMRRILLDQYGSEMREIQQTFPGSYPDQWDGLGSTFSPISARWEKK